jgi:hypothetical protein
MSASLSTDEVVVRRDKGGRLCLSKLATEGSAVGLMRVPEPKWEGEVQEELSLLLSAAIEKKWERIIKRRIADQCDGIILAFYDAYGFGGLDAARQALSGLQGYEWLHSIYWASSFTNRPNILYPESPGRSGEFLYTKQEAWHFTPNQTPPADG